MQEPAEECLCMQMRWSLFLLVEPSHLPRYRIWLSSVWQSTGQRDKAGQHALDKGQWGRERWAGRLVSMRVGEARCPGCGAHTFHLHPFVYLEQTAGLVWEGFQPLCTHCFSASFTTEGAIDGWKAHRHMRRAQKDEKQEKWEGWDGLLKSKGHQLSRFWDEEQNLYHGWLWFALSDPSLPLQPYLLLLPHPSPCSVPIHFMFFKISLHTPLFQPS